VQKAESNEGRAFTWAATARTWTWRIARVAVTAAALGWVLSRVDLSAVGAAMARVPIWTFAVAIALTALNLGVGTLRWQALLAAYGAPYRPTFARLYLLNFVGFFYNLWLPGGVGGDLVRGIASREAFGERGTTGAMAVVLVDRVLGLVGLLLVVGATSLLWPLAGVGGVLWGSAIGIALAVAAIAAIAIGRALGAFLPAKVRAIAERLPRIERTLPFAFAVALSLVTHSVVAATGHLFIVALAPEVPPSSSFTIVPLAMATAYIPITVGGAGAREAVFQQLYGSVGVSLEDATAVSLLLMATYYVTAAIGGVLPIPGASPATRRPPSAPDEHRRSFG
jgi:hypothetical protein